MPDPIYKVLKASCQRRR